MKPLPSSRTPRLLPLPRTPALLTLLPLLLLLCGLLGVPVEAAHPGWKVEALRFLNASKFTCAHMASPTPDGFFRVRDGHPSLQRALEALPLDQGLALDVSSIAGMSVDTLEALRAAAAQEGSVFSISYFYHPVLDFADTAAITYILSIYDCVISSVFITAERAAAMDFQLPHMPFGFQLMTTVPTTTKPHILSRVTACIKPFTASLWLTILALVIVSGLLIALFEGAWGHNQEFVWWQAREAKMAGQGLTDPKLLPLSSRIMDQGDRLCYSLFRAVTALSTGSAINPHTAAGRVYTGGLCICFVIIIASYTANLAAQLTTSGLPVQLINGPDSFTAAGSPCCVRNTSSHLTFVRQHFPNMPILIIAEQTEVALAEAVLAGKCAGALSTSANLMYMLAFDDRFTCALQLVGAPLNFAYFAIPWTLSKTLPEPPPGPDPPEPVANHSVADAMNLLMGELIDGGQLNQFHDDNFAQPPGTAPCPSAASGNGGAESLDIEDLAGLFIIQALFTVLSLLLFSGMKLRSRGVRSRLGDSTRRSVRVVTTVVYGGGLSTMGRRLRSRLRGASDSGCSNNERSQSGHGSGCPGGRACSNGSKLGARTKVGLRLGPSLSLGPLSEPVEDPQDVDGTYCATNHETKPPLDHDPRPDNRV